MSNEALDPRCTLLDASRSECAVRAGSMLGGMKMMPWNVNKLRKIWRSKIRDFWFAAANVVEERIFPQHFFGKSPQGSEAQYQSLFREAASRSFPETKDIEASVKFSIDTDWVNNLALHTQVVRKPGLNWQHGRVLYALLRSHISSASEAIESITVFETGTARGFSALCMAKALVDSGQPGMIITVDSLPHNDKMYWNCISDVDGPKSRGELLNRWPVEVGRVMFLQALTPHSLARIGLDRIHFAFLDAQHTFDSVVDEYEYVAARQLPGDIIVFDDVTPGVFDGVVKAVEKIRSLGEYEIVKLGREQERGYALARRL